MQLIRTSGDGSGTDNVRGNVAGNIGSRRHSSFVGNDASVRLQVGNTSCYAGKRRGSVPLPFYSHGKDGNDCKYEEDTHGNENAKGKTKGRKVMEFITNLFSKK
jgi:hypothetical protein